MNYLDATDHMGELAALNASSPRIQVRVAASATGRSLVAADALEDLGDYLAHFSAWYRKLPETDEVPVDNSTTPPDPEPA